MGIKGLTIEVVRQLDDYYESINQSRQVFQSLKDAIAAFGEREKLSEQDKNILNAMLAYNDDKELKAAWEIYSFTNDEDGLIDTLQVLVAVKKRDETDPYG